MYYSYIGTEVTGLNRKAIAGESEGQCTPQHLVHGMSMKKYEIIGGIFQSKSQVDIDEIEVEKELESSLENKLVELKDHLTSLKHSVIPQSNSRSDLKLATRQIKLLRKESQGRANAAEIAELDASEALDDYIDTLTDAYDVAELWLEDDVRTLEEIEAYDVAVDPNWEV